MDQIFRDDWDRHWTDMAVSTEAGPSPKYRTRLIMQLLGIGREQQGVHLLDIGSGLGDFAAAFHHRYPAARLTGIEMSHTGVLAASRKVPEARFIQRDLLAEGCPAGIDIEATHAVCSEVLEHLDDPERFLRSAGRYLRSGCRAVITVPGGPMSAFYRHIGHRRHYRPGELAALLERAGYAVERTYGAGFPFFNLFRILLTLRGEGLIDDVAGPRPPWHVRMGNVVFDLLFRLDLMCWGWQTIAVARWLGIS